MWQYSFYLFFFTKILIFQLFTVSFLDPCATEGPIKSLLSVYLSVRPTVRHFSQEWFIVFSNFCTMLNNWNILKMTEAFFLGKWPQNRFFWIFWKVLSLVFFWNNLKWKLIFLLICHHQFRQNSESWGIGQIAVSQSACRVF